MISSLGNFVEQFNHFSSASCRTHKRSLPATGTRLGQDICDNKLKYAQSVAAPKTNT